METEDVTAEEEKKKCKDPKCKKDDPPPWQAGLKEAKRIMRACLKAGDEVFTCHFEEAAHVADSQRHGPGALEVAMCENVTNIAVSMYNSIVLMEMERGRLDALKMRMVGGGLEVPGPHIVIPGS